MRPPTGPTTRTTRGTRAAAATGATAPTTASIATRSATNVARATRFSNSPSDLPATYSFSCVLLMTVFVPASQISPDQVTYALRTSGEPLSYVRNVHEIVREADSRIPVTNVVTQGGEIDRTISREVLRDHRQYGGDVMLNEDIHV